MKEKERRSHDRLLRE